MSDIACSQTKFTRPPSEIESVSKSVNVHKFGTKYSVFSDDFLSNNIEIFSSGVKFAS